MGRRRSRAGEHRSGGSGPDAAKRWNGPGEVRGARPPPGTGEQAESNQTLWLVIASPTIWAVHFLACYVTAAIWCAKAGDEAAPLGSVTTMVVVFTVLAAAGIALVGWLGWRRHVTGGSASAPHDTDTPEDRHRFLGFAALLLSGLSLVAVLYVASVVAFLETCL